jgi:DnaD/phage-associated family protein
MDSSTLVDNIFISEYLPGAPKSCGDVYLYGLYLCGNIQNGDNSVEMMARVLGLAPDDIINSFTYWEDLGLIHIIHKKPLEIKYLPLKSHSGIIKRIKPGKYADFNKQMQMVLCERMIQPNEYNEYYMFLETAFTEPEALVMIAKYCTDLKGANIGHHYILTVARNLAAANCRTVDTIEEKLKNHTKYDAQLKSIFKALGVRREIDFEDVQLYVKWTGFGFELSTIVAAAKYCKNKGGLKKLDANLSDYFKMNLLSIKEIDHYRAEKEGMYGLTIAINKILGLYYESLDYIVETYTVKWLNYGFDGGALQNIAKICAKKERRGLEVMNGEVEKFYSQGCITSEAIARLVESYIKTDGLIKNIFERLDLLRNITKTDRDYYKNWTEDWGFDYGLILYAAELSKFAASPIPYLNKILSDWKIKNIKTMDEAKAQRVGRDAAPVHNYPQHSYTKEQLDALFDNIDRIDI